MSTTPNPDPETQAGLEASVESDSSRSRKLSGREGDWSNRYAFGLPAGSIRALLTILILGTACGLVALRPDLPLPDYLRDLMFLILGHYFALRRGQDEPEQIGPAPLFLPRGSIRFIVIAGFTAVVVVLIRRGAQFHPEQSPAAFSLILVAGFLIGAMSRKIGVWVGRFRGRGAHRFFADLRALVALLAALVLVALAWNQVTHWLPGPRENLPERAHRNISEYGFQYYFGALVGFYFGARS